MQPATFASALLLLALSCDRPSADPIIEQTASKVRGGEEWLLGRWKEVTHPFSYIQDSTGAIVDSVDHNASYEFKDDYTYTNQKDFYIRNGGTWRFDTIIANKINLYPNAYNQSFMYGPGRTDDWVFLHDTVNNLLLIHHAISYLNNGALNGSSTFRKFKRLP